MGTYDPTLVHVQLALLALGFLLAFVGAAPRPRPGRAARPERARDPRRRARAEAALDQPRRRPARVLRRARPRRRGPLARVGRAVAARRGRALPRRRRADEERGALLRARRARRARAVRVAPLARARQSLPGPSSRSSCPGASSSRSRTCRSSSTASGTRSRPGYLADHSDRVRPALEGLLDEIFTLDWGLLVPFFVAAVVTAALARRNALAGFAAALGRARVRGPRARLLDLGDPDRARARLVGRPDGRHARRRRGRARRAARRANQPLGKARKTLNAGFLCPVRVSRPDCQPPRRGSSRSRNQSIMSMRGFLRAIVNASRMYAACFA